MLRLKVVGEKITEVETQVTRTQKEGALFAIGSLQTTGPVMSAAPEKSQLMPRDEAIKVAMFYPAGLKIGSFVKVDAPFAPDAYRIENGARTAGAGCARAGCENLKTQTIIRNTQALQHASSRSTRNSASSCSRMNFRADEILRRRQRADCLGGVPKVYGGQIHGVEAFMKRSCLWAWGSGGWDAGSN